MSLGPSYSCFINTSKYFLLLKDHCSVGADLFEGTGVNVCSDGRRYLESAICPDDFFESFFSKQVQTWHNELSSLINIAHALLKWAFIIMQFVFIMGGGQVIFQLIVFVESHSPLNIHWVAILVAFPRHTELCDVTANLTFSSLFECPS